MDLEVSGIHISLEPCVAGANAPLTFWNVISDMGHVCWDRIMVGVSLYTCVGSLHGSFMCLFVFIVVGGMALGWRVFINICSDGDNSDLIGCAAVRSLVIGCVVLG